MPNMKPVKIYTLTNPIDGKVFYVGATSQKFKARSYGSYKSVTVRFLKTFGMRPIMEEVETITDSGNVAERENYWIEQLKARGFTLENERVSAYHKKCSRVKPIDSIKPHYVPMFYYEVSVSPISQWRLSDSFSDLVDKCYHKQSA